MLVFEERGKLGIPREKPLRARTSTNNKLSFMSLLDRATQALALLVLTFDVSATYSFT